MASSTATWPRIGGRDALLVVVFAGLTVLARGGLRGHLHVPGHAMFATTLFLILARGCVPRAGAATATGLLAGVGWAALCVGRGGPLAALDLVLPALIVDAGAALQLGRLPASLRWGAIGAVAGAAGFLPPAARELAMGTSGFVLVQHPALAAAAKAGFGALGGGAAAVALGRLRMRGATRDEPPASFRGGGG